MKKIKVFWNGQPLREIYPHATSFQVFKYRAMKLIARLVKWSVGLSVGVAIMLGFFMAGSNLYPKTVIAMQEEVLAPVLVRVGYAESHNSHFCTEELVKARMCSKSEIGQVLLNANSDGSVDIGKYQINNYHWGAVASKMGLNLFAEQDNETFAIWIYKNYGTEPWSASKKNWK